MSFDEVIVRTYVRGIGGRGMFFLNVESGSALASLVGRALLGLPVQHARVRREVRGREIAYASRRGDSGVVRYPTAIGDTTYFKDKQWQVTNYAVLTYIAVVAIATTACGLNRTISPVEMYSGVAIIIIAALSALCALESLCASLDATRKCVEKTIHFLSPTFRECYKVKWAQVETDKRDWPFPNLFRLYIIAGSIVACWILVTWF